MAEPAAIDDAMAGVLPVPPSEWIKPSVFCAHCAADVTALPVAARFCNRCGSALPSRRVAPASLPPPPSATAGGIESQIPSPEPTRPPLILLAYAKALVNLGHRYETAIGSQRNLEEAARCYWKAARLGDLTARERFGADSLATDPLPYQPVASPGDSRAYRDPAPPFASAHAPSPYGPTS